jgi:hypothetical protein
MVKPNNNRYVDPGLNHANVYIRKVLNNIHNRLVSLEAVISSIFFVGGV